MAMSVVYSNAFGGVFAENRGGVVSIYVPDTQGSTIGLVSSSGVLTDRWVYWPYGEVASRSGTNVTPLTWLGTLGYFLDALPKLFYVRARHLRADLARWLTVDPLWPEQPAYSYCGGKPSWVTDPSGLQKKILPWVPPCNSLQDTICYVQCNSNKFVCIGLSTTPQPFCICSGWFACAYCWSICFSIFHTTLPCGPLCAPICP